MESVKLKPERTSHKHCTLLDKDFTLLEWECTDKQGEEAGVIYMVMS